MEPGGGVQPGLLLRVLGPLRVERDGAQVPLPPAERAVLARLALAAARPVSTSALIEAIWPAGAAPLSARASLHNHLARLRVKLGPDVLARVGDRYRLGTDVVVDADLLAGALDRGERALADGAVEDACAVAERALSLVAGAAYSELLSPDAEAAAAGLREVAASLEDVRATALLALHRTTEAVAVLQRLVTQDSGRERRWTLLVQALHADGRRGEALATFTHAKRSLAARDGLDPGPSLAAAARNVLEDVPGVAHPQGAGGSLPVVSVPLVGRDDELDRLERRVRDGSRLIALVGPAGVGTTTLAGALARRLTRRHPHSGRPGTVVRTRCETAPDLPLQPLMDAAEILRDRLGTEKFVMATGLDSALLLRDGLRRTGPPTLYGPADIASRLVRVLGRGGAALGGLVLIVDDVQLAGPTTASVLARLAGAGAGDAVVLLTAPDAPSLPVDLAGADIEPIGGLSAAAVRALVAGLLGRPVADVAELGDWLAQQSGGSPGLTRELLAALVEEGAVRLGSPGRLAVPQEADVPRRLATELRQRLVELGGGVRRAMEAAVLLADTSSPSLLAHLCSPGDLLAARTSGLLVQEDDAAAPQRAGRLVQPSGPGAGPGRRLRPVSGLVARVVAADTPPGRRLELLAAAAAAAADLGLPPEIVARYRVEAVELDPVSAAEAARAAGEAAGRHVAFAEAAAWFARALSATPQHSSDQLGRLELIVAMGDAQRLAGTTGHDTLLLDAAERVLALAEAAPRADERLTSLRRRAALAVAQLGGTTQTGTLDARAAAVADRAIALEPDPQERAVLAAAASMIHSMSGRSDRCRELFLGAEADSRHLDARQPVAGLARRSVLPFAYLALGHPDDLALRIAAANELREGAEAAGDPVAAFEGWHLTASVAMLTCDGPLLRQAHARLGRLVDVVGDAGRRWSWYYTDAALAHLEGRLHDAEQHSERAFEVASGIAESRAMAVYGAQLLDIRRAQGRLGELAELFEDLVTTQPGTIAWRAATALARLASGPQNDPDAARRHLDVLLGAALDQLPRDFVTMPTLAYAGRAAAQLGAATRTDSERLELLLARLSPHDGLAVWQGTCSYGPVALICARLALACSDLVGARRFLVQAHALAVRLQASLFVREADSLAAELAPLRR